MQSENIRKEMIIQLETNVDHLTGEEIGVALELLNAMPEVLDAIWISAIGKKNRPCGLLQVLCRPDNETTIVSAIFRHSHSLGIRRLPVERYVLARDTVEIKMGDQSMAAKSYQIDGASYIRPESDYIKKKVQQTGLGAPAFRILKKD